MNSVQKAHLVLEELADLDDDELADYLPVPVPPSVIHAVIAFAAPRIPEDPGALDQFLTEVGNFCHQLRSDEQPAHA